MRKAGWFLVIATGVPLLIFLPLIVREYRHEAHYRALEREGKLRAKITVLEAPKTALAPHQKVQCKLEVNNLGTTTWTAAEGFKLGGFERDWKQSRVDPARLDPGRIVVPKDIKQGETWHPTFDLEVPEKPGTYRLHLQMLRERDVSPGVPAPDNTWFGGETVITVRVR